jgi:hypothetical protein
VEPVYFPPGKASNIVRGALGIHLKAVAEESGRRDVYERIFQPALESGAGPSGLADPPRPYLFRAKHLDGQTVGRGDAFHFDLHLFETREGVDEIVAAAFARVGAAGLGPGRARAELRAIDGKPVRLDLMPRRERVERVRVRFVTPTELKADGRVVTLPEFGVLVSRIRDRISTLRALYGPGPLVIDFESFGERALNVRIVRSDLKRLASERKSSRTGQSHSIGGFVGEVDYAGEMSEFVPYLDAARWTGVGRHTVWGNGELHMEPM